MSTNQNLHGRRMMAFVVLLSVFLPHIHAFTSKPKIHPTIQHAKTKWAHHRSNPHLFPTITTTASIPSHHSLSTTRPPTQLYMSDREGPGTFTAIIIVALIAIFVGTSLSPMLDVGSPTGGDLNLGDAVVTRQDTNKLQNYESKFDKLSRSKIQEKLNRVPVFYLAESGESMKENIYMSFDDAMTAAEDIGGSVKVKCTTLDQVMYPLVLKRGRMRMAPPPEEVQKAEQTEDMKFKLVPSTTALKDAEETNLTPNDGDVPLFVAERLAFAGTDGPQVPLFLEKEDCITSYNRLREAKGSRIPVEPNIRTTTLMDVLYSMEKGTRPAVSQLQFYATAGDLIRASEMLGY